MKGYLVHKTKVIAEFPSIEEAESELSQQDFYHGKMWSKQENRFILTQDISVISEHDAKNFAKEHI